MFWVWVRVLVLGALPLLIAMYALDRLYTRSGLIWGPFGGHHHHNRRPRRSRRNQRTVTLDIAPPSEFRQFQVITPSERDGHGELLPLGDQRPYQQDETR